MKSRSNAYSKPTARSHRCCTPASTGCTLNFQITTSGDVHIHNECAPAPKPDREPREDCALPPSTGTCLPLVAGAKHKLSREQKLAARALHDPITSALATSVISAMRRFVKGASPANELEEAAFATFGRMPLSFLECTLAGIDTLPGSIRDRIFVPSLVVDDNPISVQGLTDALIHEIEQRAGQTLFNDPNAAAQERAGFVRLYVPQGEDFTRQVRICRIRNLRTASYTPVLSDGEYLPEEIQHDCAPVTANGITQTVCQVRSDDCPGNIVAGVCGRVLDVAQGDGVELDGVNFFNVAAVVRLTDKVTRTIVREVDTFVWGDVSTPVSEAVEGVSRLVNDCRVRDKLTFQVPVDLPSGIYSIEVVVPNNTGNPAFGVSLTSNEEFINVLPPIGTRFQLVVDQVVARVETSPVSFGSDEVGLRTVAIGLKQDLQPTETQIAGFKSLRGIEFDSGTTHRFVPDGELAFRSNEPILFVSIGVLGYEIDSRHAYDNQINEWMDYFVYLVEKQWETVALAVVGLGGAQEVLRRLGSTGWTGAIAIGIGLAVLAAIDLIISCWAPADKIIEDNLMLSIVDLDRLTSANSPAPPSSTHKTGRDIVVNVNTPIPPEKIPLQYRETREYVSDEQDSRYMLTYRYNRLA